MKNLCLVLSLLTLPALGAGAKGPWKAEVFPTYEFDNALGEAQARFRALNHYAMAFLFWRVEIEFESPPGDDGVHVIDWREVARDPQWGPWMKLATATRATPSEIRFGSEKREPGSFFIDGQVRIAKTGRNPGDPIVVNEDLILRQDPLDGQMKPIDDLEIISILVHEHAHHMATFGLDLAHETLDRHASIVRQRLEPVYRVVDYGSFPPDPILPREHRPGIIFAGYHDVSHCDMRIVLVRDSRALYDLTPIFDNEKYCIVHPDYNAFSPMPPAKSMARGPHTGTFTVALPERLLAKARSGADQNPQSLYVDFRLGGNSYRFIEVDYRE